MYYFLVQDENILKYFLKDETIQTQIDRTGIGLTICSTTIYENINVLAIACLDVYCKSHRNIAIQQIICNEQTFRLSLVRG